MTDKSLESKRLTNSPYYFASATIAEIVKSVESEKQEFFSEILNFQQFSIAVSIKYDERYLELIPESRKNNYWRDGVHKIDERVYRKVLSLAGFVLTGGH